MYKLDFRKVIPGVVLLTPGLIMLFVTDKDLLASLPTPTLILLCVAYSTLGAFLIVITLILLPLILYLSYLYFANWIAQKEIKKIEASFISLKSKISEVEKSLQQLSGQNTKELKAELKEMDKEMKVNEQLHVKNKADIQEAQEHIKITIYDLFQKAIDSEYLTIGAVNFMIVNLCFVTFYLIGLIRIESYKGIFTFLSTQLLVYVLMSFISAYYLLRRFTKSHNKSGILPLRVCSRLIKTVFLKI